MKRMILLFLCIICVVSCGKRNLQRVLTGGSYRYWQSVSNHRYRREDSAYYYFDKYGRCIIFINKYGNMHELDGGDAFYTPLWKWKDSILVIAGDESYVKEMKSNRILILVKFINITYVDTLEAIPYVKIPMQFRHYYNGPTRYIPEAIR